MVARSLTLRAVIALLLLVSFYVFGLAVGAGLIASALWSVTAASSVNLKAVVILFAAGGSVLVGLIPTFSRWKPPGTRLEEREQPRLFGLIRQVAQQMGQPMPAEVYLFPEVNAFVVNAGGVLGLGGKRVLGVGLGLLAATNVSQFKAILAHEFGHFAGGDVRLGGLTSATRGVMIRTLQSVSQNGGGLVARPFSWMFRLYLRITQAISRQQELIADEWGVRIAGKTAHASGLRQVALAGASWELFRRLEVEPLAQLGVAPRNLFEGFRSFSSSSALKDWEAELQASISQSRRDPYDSHPPLAERIAWAHAQSGSESALDATPASSLLDRLESLEAGLSPPAGQLQPLEWSETGPVRARGLERRAAHAQVRVEELTVQRALDVLAQPHRWPEFAEAVDPVLIRWTLPDRTDRIAGAIRSAMQGYFGVLLTARGFNWRSSPGEPLWLEKGEQTVRLYDLLDGILQGKKPLDSLVAALGAAGVARSETVPVEEKLRWELERPRCEVKLEPRGSSVLVYADLPTLVLPRCCGVCRKDAVQVTRTRFTVGGFFGREGDWVELDVATCGLHETKAKKALSVRSYRPMVGEVGIEVKDAEYAELIQTVNA